MGDRILYRGEVLEGIESDLNKLAGALGGVASELEGVDTSAEWWSKLQIRGFGGDSISALRTLRSKTGAEREGVERLSENVRRTRERFDMADAAVSGIGSAVRKGADYRVRAAAAAAPVAADSENSFWEDFWERFGWEGLLSGSNYIGRIYEFFQKHGGDAGAGDFIQAGIEAGDFFQEAYETFRNYMRTGRMVGRDTALKWWFKNITGLKKIKYTSQARTFSKRFVNNLTNKTSPFHKQLMDTLGDFGGKNGAGKCFASWAGIAVEGALNFFDNKQEQAASGGSMSDGRVWAETITETGVNTALTFGAGALIGAGVAAATSVALPAVVLAAASGAIVAGANVLVEHLSGKSVTEWASDLIVDTGESIAKGFGAGARAVKNSFALWYGALAY